MNERVSVGNEKDGGNRLVDAKGLLDNLFDPTSRPSLRWLRQMQSQRRIPYLKIGHLVFFDVEKVRNALVEKCEIQKK